MTLAPTDTRTWTTATGRLTYDPRALSVEQKPWWLIVQCHWDWHRLYSMYVDRHIQGDWAKVVDLDRVFTDTHPHRIDKDARLGILRPEFLMPAWGPHISVVRGERPTTREGLQAWKYMDGSVGVFQVSVDLKRGNKHWWLDVQCPDLLDLRERLGLPRTPKIPLHLTLGVSP